MNAYKSQARRRTLRNREIRRNWDMYLLILIPFVSLLLFNYVPMAGVALAFKDYKIFKGFAGSECQTTDKPLRLCVNAGVRYIRAWSKEATSLLMFCTAAVRKHCSRMFRIPSMRA